MSHHYKAGDRVSYPVGRGRSEGRIILVREGFVVLETSGGKKINRSVVSICPLPVDPPAQEAA